jgi:hypothetical protein
MLNTSGTAVTGVSWLPTVFYSIAALVPMVWLLMDDAHEAAATQAIGVVVVMLVVGGVATVLLLAGLGGASVLQFGGAVLSLAGVLGGLGYFGRRVGILSVVTAIFDPIR